MLRDAEERELDRTFTKIETWEEFLSRWAAIDTEQEAVGLLYAGTTIPPFNTMSDPTDRGEKSRQIQQRVQFYIHQSRQKNSVVSTVAQQLIVKHWLGYLILWYADLEGYFNAHRRALEFLGVPRDQLRESPYPRFVTTYLLGVYEHWSHGSHPDYRRGKAHHRLQSLTKPLIRAMCVWGLGFKLGISGDRQHLELEEIQAFLQERNFNIGAVLSNLAAYGVPPTRLRDEQANEGGAQAYLRILYRAGGGFKAQRGKISPLPDSTTT